jgi:sugar O-acyltransferase (sialic acid O-acetyltransferase NeuD family)
MKPYVIWGGKGHAKVIRDSLGNEHELKAVFDNNYGIKSPFNKIPIRYGIKEFEDWANGKDINQYGFAIAIGGGRGKERLDIAKLLCSYGLSPLKVIHPFSYISPTAILGDGCQVLAMASISSESSIGNQTIINNHVNVDHECSIRNGVHLSPGATLGGNIIIEDLVWVGINATIFPNITIGSGAIIGAGAVVRHNVAPNTIVAGNPARIIRKD